MNEKVKEYYDKTASEYESFFEKNPNLSIIGKIGHKFFREPYVYKRLRAVVNLAKIKPSDTLLDVGCGNGKYAVEFAKLGANVTGIDFSKPMLDIAKKHASNSGKNIKFIEADIFSYNGKFDTVVCSGVFDYTPEYKRLMLKLKEISSNRIVITYPKLYNIQMPVRKIWLKLRDVPVVFYTKDQINELFEECKLKEEDEIDIGPLVIKSGLV